MSESARFAYVQARLQARHGARPDERLWHRLASIGDLANYLQVAQRSALGHWVGGVQARQSSHEIELSLRRQFRDHVDEVSRWLPTRWAASVRWVKRLVDLPALRHLLSGEAAPLWMRDDPALMYFAGDSLASRIESMQNSDCAELVRAWHGQIPLYEAWLDCWRRQWPNAPQMTAGLQQVGKILLRHIHAQQADNGASMPGQREPLVQELHGAFRRYSFQPAAAYAHLALTALDLEQLRGDLLARRLFPEMSAEARP